MGSKGGAPQAPDPYKAAAAQEQYGTQAASFQTALDRTNTQNPYGSQSWTQTVDPRTGAPVYTQHTNLTPQQQAIFNAQQGLENTTAGQATQALNKPFNLQTSVNNPSLQMNPDFSGVPGIVGANDLAGYRDASQQAAYKNQAQYLDPQFQQGREQLDAQLRNSGAHPGDPAYDNAMKLFNNQQQQAYESAYNNSFQTGLEAQQAQYGESANTNQQLAQEAIARQQAGNSAAGQQFGQNLQAGGFSNQALAQARDQALSEFQSLYGGAGAPNFGGGGSAAAGNLQAPDFMSAQNNAYQGQLAKYNADVQQQNAELSSAATIAAAFMLM